VIADENWPPLFDRTAAMAVLYAFLSRRFNLKQLY
jgi:hypothetical protein